MWVNKKKKNLKRVFILGMESFWFRLIFILWMIVLLM